MTATLLADVRVLSFGLTLLGSPWMLLDMPDGCPECAHPVPGLSDLDDDLDGWWWTLHPADETWIDRVRTSAYGRRWTELSQAAAEYDRQLRFDE